MVKKQGKEKAVLVRKPRIIHDNKTVFKNDHTIIHEIYIDNMCIYIVMLTKLTFLEAYIAVLLHVPRQE